ncbi:MAG: hypothetical protein AB7N80_11615 [Bdellovibrionales bacterium]
MKSPLMLTLTLALWAGLAQAQDVIREGTYDGGTSSDGGTTTVFIKAVTTEMPGRRNTNYFGLIVSQMPSGGMLAKPYKIEERGGRQAWIPLHQACTTENSLCQFTGFLSLPAKMEAYYTGFLTMQGDVETLRLNPAAPYSREKEQAMPAPCQEHDFGRHGLRRISSTAAINWFDIAATPNSTFRFVRNWADASYSERDAARLSVTMGSSGSGRTRGFYLDSTVRYGAQNGNAIYELRPGNYSMNPTMAGLGEVRMQLDDASSRSGTAVAEPMSAVGILMRKSNRNFLLMMDARPGYDNCNMTAMAFVQE